jgi:hypothetical protein
MTDDTPTKFECEVTIVQAGKMGNPSEVEYRGASEFGEDDSIGATGMMRVELDASEPYTLVCAGLDSVEDLCTEPDPVRVMFKRGYATFDLAERAANKIYSQVLGAMPFVVTGVACNGTDAGYYPPIPKEIAAIKDLPLKHRGCDYSWVTIIRGGRVKFTLMVNDAGLGLWGKK